jgi:excisionase family DNA binding protein
MEKKQSNSRTSSAGGDGSLPDISVEKFANAPLMMTADELAKTLCISLRQVWRLKAKGDLPKPVSIGRNVRWRRSDIEEWIKAGCPSSSSLLNSLLYHLILRPYLFLRG